MFGGVLWCTTVLGYLMHAAVNRMLAQRSQKLAMAAVDLTLFTLGEQTTRVFGSHTLTRPVVQQALCECETKRSKDPRLAPSTESNFTIQEFPVLSAGTIAHPRFDREPSFGSTRSLGATGLDCCVTAAFW